MARKTKGGQAEPPPTRIPSGRGGWRPGAGRPRKQGQRNVDHVRRPLLEKDTPVHVTLRIGADVGSMRRRAGFQAVRDALIVSHERSDRFRIVQVSIQQHRIHLVCEARNRRTLARGMQAFCISFARQLNRRLRRSGQVFVDRYQVRPMVTPREVRDGLRYILNNWRLHGEHRRTTAHFDPYSSALTFDGWASAWRDRIPQGGQPLPTAEARSALLTTDWRRYGLIKPTEPPGTIVDDTWEPPDSP